MEDLLNKEPVKRVSQKLKEFEEFEKIYPSHHKQKTLRMQGFKIKEYFCGAERDRTADLMTASHALSQLSYSPKIYIFTLLVRSIWFPRFI